jgi:hypothetical protein
VSKCCCRQEISSAVGQQRVQFERGGGYDGHWFVIFCNCGDQVSGLCTNRCLHHTFCSSCHALELESPM